MKKYLTTNPWSIIENEFHKEFNKISESVFSIGNGKFGHRANFEEKFSGPTLLGNYVAGIYYPDKTKVGWWKNGYPEYFAKVLNSINWIYIHITIDNQDLDLNTCEVSNFKRELNMKEGFLSRSFVAKLQNGKEVKVESKRFCSIVNDEIGAIRYTITPLNFSGKISFSVALDGNIKNQDSNYDEYFWDQVANEIDNSSALLVTKTKKTNFEVASAMNINILRNNSTSYTNLEKISSDKFCAYNFNLDVNINESITIEKTVSIVSSLNINNTSELIRKCKDAINIALEKGFDKMLIEQAKAWEKKWAESDIVIEGDIEAQQGIRFNIFQLNQTYTGEDPKLNIGPKGFTGEKYGGCTYWDTEAYCIPFYLATANQSVAKNLLLYRYKQLDKAIENAQKLGFKNGAALYPMVTMNGEECHNEWEITFEEIHRNGAISYAIYDYIRYTNDKYYLAEAGIYVLVAIARFWSQRVNWSNKKQKFVMLGVTGPNEYENNINNNWYTNYIASWCMKYASECIEYLKNNHIKEYNTFVSKANFNEIEELKQWKNITDNIYLPEDNELGIFLQQDDYLDKEQILVKDLPKEDRPLNQNWSWDRILRSCFIKQADVLQGIFFFENDFDIDTIRRNYDFYEPRTVHESSLSPCVHSIIASKLGDYDRAYEFYLRTSRLDLDDYNNDTEDGCHTTSMAGTWMSLVHGFGGMRINNDNIHLYPFIPKNWSSFSFKINFRNSIIHVKTEQNKVYITNYNNTNNTISLFVYNTKYNIHPNQTISINKYEQ